jgi:hypothetical protein
VKYENFAKDKRIWRNINRQHYVYISARRATESDYGLITKDNKPLEFETEQGARKWASANIEEKYDCKLVHNKSRSN